MSTCPNCPDMPGSEVLRRRRIDSARSETPVIVIRADVSTEQIRRLEKLAICEYLKKPFDLKDLRRAISDALHASLTS